GPDSATEGTCRGRRDYSVHDTPGGLASPVVPLYRPGRYFDRFAHVRPKPRSVQRNGWRFCQCRSLTRPSVRCRDIQSSLVTSEADRSGGDRSSGLSLFASGGTAPANQGSESWASSSSSVRIAEVQIDDPTRRR